MRHVGTRRWLFLALAALAVAAVAVLAPLLSVLRTSAQPVGGAVYTGTHSGGGDVEFEVSADGSQVLGFTASDVVGTWADGSESCDLEGDWLYPLPLDIGDDHTFGPGIPGLDELSGEFPSAGTAQGTFRVVVEAPPPYNYVCDSGTLTWTATAPTPTPTATPSPTPTATPSPTSTATPTPTPTATPTPTPEDLAAGWNQLCYLGTSQDIQDALTGISENVLAVYRLRSDQGYDKWFPGRQEVSTISTLSPYESLLLLLAGSTSWSQQPSSPQPPSASLVQGWNSVCYTGESKDVLAATQSIDSQFAVLYALGSDQVWQRFVAGRPEISNLTQLSRFASVLILVTEEGGTQWSFGP